MQKKSQTQVLFWGSMVLLGGCALAWPSVASRGAGIILKQTLLSPVFVIAVAVIMLIEKLFPVHRHQATFSLGLIQDGVWVVLALAFNATVMVCYARTLTAFYEAHLRFLTVHASDSLPRTVSFGIAILLADLLAWFQHWLKHKVPWFWQIHAVHHSQPEINLFTDFRFHLFEYLISRPIVMLPLLMLSLKTPEIVWWSVFYQWYTRFYHANIKSNLGPLRQLLVTPQSHRVHHSIETRHQDKNFGVLFSFWDRLFGTRYAGCGEYPQTGIRDTAFPLENKEDPMGLLFNPIRQNVYPFLTIAKNFGKR